MRNLVSSFSLLLGFVFGTTAAELGASTEANPPQLDNNTITEALVPVRQLPPELHDIIMPADYNTTRYSKSLQDPQIGLILRVSKIAILEEQAKVYVTLDVKTTWTDARLRLAPYSNITKYNWEEAPLAALEHIWHPRTMIALRARDSGGSARAKVISFNRAHEFEWKQWNRTGCVGCIRCRRTTRSVTLQLHADMHFKFFPNDKHMTTFRLATRYTTYRLMDYRIPIRRAAVLFSSKSHKEDDTFDIHVASNAFTAALHNSISHHFDFTILFNRRMETYIYKIYIPSGLLVVLCFLSMLLPAEVAGERVALCATTLVSITLFINTAAQSGKAVSYLRPIDIWLLGCTAFVILILFQSIVIFRISAKKFKKRNPKDMKQAVHSLSVLLLQMQEKQGGFTDYLQHNSAPYDDNDLERKAQEGPKETVDEPRRRSAKIAEVIDRLSLITFVIILAVCNGIYWSWLLHTIQQKCEHDEHCRERLIDTDDYQMAAKDLLYRLSWF